MYASPEIFMTILFLKLIKNHKNYFVKVFNNATLPRNVYAIVMNKQSIFSCCVWSVGVLIGRSQKNFVDGKPESTNQ